MKRYWAFKALKMTLLFVGFVSLVALAVMLLWNALIPALFGGTSITWIQALGLLVLARLLTGRGGFGGFGTGRGKWRSRWANMTPEEREKWKEGVGGLSCGYGEGKEPPPEVA